jgi:hypothetical protein
MRVSSKCFWSSQVANWLLAVRLQHRQLQRHRLHWLNRHDAQPTYLDHLRLPRRPPNGAYAQTDRRDQVLLDRLACQTGRAGDGTLALLELPAPNHFFNLHPMQLPIAHTVHLVRGGRDGGERSLGWPKAWWRSARQVAIPRR